LDEFGQKDAVANITGVAVMRELGPLIAAIVLTGFAGAAITAEIGTMVVGEEIEALEAHALNPVRFLVVPRVIATVVSMTALAVISDTVAVLSGMFMGNVALGIPTERYIDNTLDQLKTVDFLTGIGKATVFGLLIGLIACSNGLRVTGGAAGVGKATTGTVVQSVVSIVIADLIFTAIFYELKLV
jgi:phospholipid/cholesterol/gamma-HCH transport system permease protein